MTTADVVPELKLQYMSGDGWTAELLPRLCKGFLHVTPWEDQLPVAIAVLIPVARQAFVTVEWVGTDPAGWDIYELEGDLAP